MSSTLQIFCDPLESRQKYPYITLQENCGTERYRLAKDPLENPSVRLSNELSRLALSLSSPSIGIGFSDAATPPVADMPMFTADLNAAFLNSYIATTIERNGFINDVMSVSLTAQWPIMGRRWNNLKNSINELQNAPSNYDESDNVAPSPQLITSALSFVERAQIANIPIPKEYSFDSDGEITFRWSNDCGLAAISFVSDNHIVGYVSDLRRSHLLKIDDFYSQELDLVEFFRALRTFV